MALAMKKYRLRPHSLAAGTLEGFSYNQENQTLELDPTATANRIAPLVLDSGVNGCVWGRVQLDITLSPGATFLLSYYASDVAVGLYEKADQLVGGKDGLLAGQSGRYLYLWLEVFGATSGTCSTWEIWTPDDPFVKTFPQVYREQNGFFKRYLSIFSSIYLDFQDEIEKLYQWVDVERAPADKLPALGAWMGVDLSPQLYSPELMMKILKKMPYCQAYKGSPKVIVDLAELLTEKKCILVERCNLQDFSTSEAQDTLQQLYGETVFDYTLLIHGAVDGQVRKQLTHLLRQFQPVRAKCNLVFLKPNSHLGSYGYLDINATLHQAAPATLDREITMGGAGILT